MELQFKKKSCSCVDKLLSNCKEQELTQEVRLPDSMADIGRVLGAWGQVLIRGKEWRPDRVAASGGVMCWILYVPEGDTQPRMVETWLPFHEQWPIPDTQHDGTIITSGYLSFCDARSVSARKVMVRAGLCLDTQVYASAAAALYTPEELPDHVQVHTVSHKVLLPAEAGEKSFTMQEQIPLPPDCAPFERILRYSLLPQIVEVRVSGGRVIFRGICNLHVTGMGADGKVHSCDTELPFSQYTQLDREYEEGAEASVRPVVTNLELEQGENGLLNMKAGISGQYLINQPTVLELAEDAYSPRYALELTGEQITLPTFTHQYSAVVDARRSEPSRDMQVVDVTFEPGPPMLQHGEDGSQLLLCGRFRVLYYDPQGELQYTTVKWDGGEAVNCQEDAQLCVSVSPCGKAEAAASELCGQFLLEHSCNLPAGLQMLTAVTVGQEKEQSEDRPAIVVRKAGNGKLWTIAKESGSTVAAICAMNGLTDEPEPEQILLIPIM